MEIGGKASAMSPALLERASRASMAGFSTTVQHHVHAGDAQHGGVEVETVEELAVEVALQLFVVEQVGMVFSQVFTGRHQETGFAAGIP